MNVRLQFDLEFVAGLYYEDQLRLNTYSVCICLLTKTTDSLSSNIALERLKWFVNGELSNVVFFGPDSLDQAEIFYTMGVNVCTLPVEPLDQCVGIMLYNKLTAIMEGRMVVTSLDICSTEGDRVWYQHDEDDSQGPFALDGWWHKANLRIETFESTEVLDNVVRVETTAWREMDMGWPDESTAIPGNTVVYPNFKRDENKPTQ